MLNKLLDLGRDRGKLAEKHHWRLKLALGVPTLQMDIDSLLANRVDTWMERRASANAKISYHANESLQNITSLHDDHPLRKELNNRTLRMKMDRESRKTNCWANLLSASRGEKAGSGEIQILADATGIADETANGGTSVVDDKGVAPELKKAALRWTVYPFPVRYVPTKIEEDFLKQLRKWSHKYTEGKKAVLEALLNVYNAEQKK